MALSEFARNEWIQFSVAMAFMLLRFTVRWIMVGPRNFDLTDVFCVLSGGLFTILTTCDYLLQTPAYPTIINLTPKTAMEVPDDQIPAYEYGSKVALFSWTMYICMLFAFKGVMLSLYRKLSTGIQHHEEWVLYTTIFTVCCWIASVLTHLLACRPLSRTWQVKPYPGPICTIRPQNYYVIGPLNMLTDLMIIAIPMPLLWKLQIPLRRKLVLAGLFGSGIFIIICTILRMIFALGTLADMSIAQAWAGREGFVAMIVVSAPGIWPLMRKTKWFDDSYYARGSGPSAGRSGGSAGKRLSKYFHNARNRSGMRSQPSGKHDEPYELSKQARKGATRLGDGESDEHIISDDNRSILAGKDDAMPITITTEYSVAHEEMGIREARRH